MRRILLVPDSFKGTLSSRQVCEIMAQQLGCFFPEADMVSIPVADGGEGSVDAFLAAVGGQRKTLTVTGSGTINGVLYADKNATLVVQAGDNFQVNSISDQGNAVYGAMGSVLDIANGTYIASCKGSVINTASAKSLSMKNTVVTVDSASMINSIGITGNASTVYLENVTVNAQYSRAVYLNYQYGTSVIKGGTFITDKVSPEWLPNPTIQYAGTLEISNASITRVGHGILYKVNYPTPTEVVGLTQSNVTFTQAAAAVAGYTDVAFG